MSPLETRQDLLRRLKVLSERLWERRCSLPDIEAWLTNFTGRHCEDRDLEQLHALHLLAFVSYFGLRELRVLLRSLYRDLYQYPIIQDIRSRLGGTTALDEIQARVDEELQATRFLGMGNAAESGTHLLYYFRQENHLPLRLFVHQHELLTSAATDPAATLASDQLKRVVFIDDLCGSGNQAVRYSRSVLKDLKNVAARTGRVLEFQYLVLFGVSKGLERAVDESEFDVIRAVCELDSSYTTFGAESRVLGRPPDHIERATSERLARGYGAELWPKWPVGYRDGQLLLAFHHNIPNNSLPILWFDDEQPPWHAAFPRQRKVI